MRIVCPQCSAAYEVPDDRVAAGRTVRCARCSGSWTPIPIPAPPQAPDPQTAPDPAPPEPVAATSPADAAVPSADPAAPDPISAEAAPHAAVSGRRAVGRAALLGAWVVSLALLAGLGWAAVVHRNTIMKAWPPSERAYFALGLTPRAPVLSHP